MADAVRARGLDVDWDGDVRTRIKVRMAWQRRRVGRLAAFAPEDGPTLVAVRRLDPWYGPFALTDGPLPATRLAALCLPWLPARTRLRVEPEGGEAMVLRRERDRLIAAYDDGRPERAVDRTRAGELLGLDAGSSVHSGGSGRGGHSGPPSLDVTYDCRLGSEAAEVPLDLFESVALLRAMPPRTGSWACFGGAAGGVIQIRWEDGRLWLETPDPSTRTSLGRYVSLTEAEGMVSMLAIEGRVAVSELDGLQRIAWD